MCPTPYVLPLQGQQYEYWWQRLKECIPRWVQLQQVEGGRAGEGRSSAEMHVRAKRIVVYWGAVLHRPLLACAVT